MWWDVEEVIDRQLEGIKQRAMLMDELWKVRTAIRGRLSVMKVEGDDSGSVVAVDSSSKALRYGNGFVRYIVLGVAVWFRGGHRAGVFFNEERSGFLDNSVLALYEESSVDDEILLSALRVVCELTLLSEHINQYRWALMDGGLFSALINLKKGLEAVNHRKDKDSIYEKVGDLILGSLDALESVLSSGTLLALPKRSSRNEFVSYVSKVFGEAHRYSDYELALILLNKGEYVDLTSMVNVEDIRNLISSLRALGYNISDRAVKLLESFGLYYVKGYGGGIHRVEFFGPKDYFPAGLVYALNVDRRNVLELIEEADNLAKTYLDLCLVKTEKIFDFYR